MKCILDHKKTLNLTSALKIEEYWKDNEKTIVEFPSDSNRCQCHGFTYLLNEDFDTVMDFINSDEKIFEASFREKLSQE